MCVGLRRRWGGILSVMSVAVLGGALMAARGDRVGAAARTTNDRVYSETQAKRGKELYTAKCTQCHGETLRGTEYAPPLTGDAFLDVWTNHLLAELMDKTQQTMPQNDPGSLDRKQAVDIIAYILQVNKWPAGDADLTEGTDVLNAITIGK